MKKYFIIVLLFCLTLAFNACGNNEETTPLKGIISINISDKSSYVMEDGVKLEYEVYPDEYKNEVRFSTSNSDVLDIEEDGTMIFKNEGNVIINVTSKFDEKICDSMEIEVKRPFIKRIILDSEHSMKVGVSEKLNPIFNPKYAAGEIRWESTDPTIAVVTNDGVVTGLKEGSATIICKLDDDPLVSAGMYITFIYGDIIEDEVIPNGISINTIGYILVGQQVTLSVNFDPYNSYKDLIWSSSDEKIVSVSQTGVITGLMVGTATIKCTSKYDENIYGTIIVEVKKITN